MLDQVLHRLDSERDAAVARMIELLAIPSLSADPAHRPHIDQAARWLGSQLRELGFDVALRDTGGPPAVVARTRPESVANPAAPRVLFYGHYDVQPADPVDLWTSPPFEPTVRDGAVYARGASDDKGQVCCFLEALRAWRDAAGKYPGPLTVLIEGEEEVGSVHLEKFLADNKADLAADVALVSDTTLWEGAAGAPPQPAITYALRGLLYYDIKLFGPARDLHSGVYGGTLANPNTLLARILGKLLDDDHRVTIPGFYDDVLPRNEDEEAAWAKLGFDENAFLGGVGVAVPHGEAGMTTLQRRWSRPACDINGLYGGYTGEGAKTVIPAMAGAKVSFRLAANQNARDLAQKFEAWLRSHDTRGCRWQLTNLGEADPAAVPIDSRWVAAAQRGIARAAGRPAVLVRDGATIPVGSWFKSVLGLDTLFVGFGLNGDQIHSPDEHFALDRFSLGCRTHAALLAELASAEA